MAQHVHRASQLRVLGRMVGPCMPPTRELKVHHPSQCVLLASLICRLLRRCQRLLHLIAAGVAFVHFVLQRRVA